MKIRKAKIGIKIKSHLNGIDNQLKEIKSLINK